MRRGPTDKPARSTEHMALSFSSVSSVVAERHIEKRSEYEVFS
jgi:hypothetical protein